MKLAQGTSGILIFLREICVNPKAMGAAWPSSKHLAKAMIDLVPQNTDGLIVELGAGTGIITQELLNKFPSQKVRVVERSKDLCMHLQKRFNQLPVIHGDAQDLSKLLTNETEKTTTIISGLPLRVLPQETVKNIQREIRKVLAPDGKLIQFTYALHHNFIFDGFKHHLKKYVWLNMPPARIDVYKPNHHEQSL